MIKNSLHYIPLFIIIFTATFIHFLHISFFFLFQKEITSFIIFCSVHFTAGVIGKTDPNLLIPLPIFVVIGFLSCCLLILVGLSVTYYVVLTSLLINTEIKTEEAVKPIGSAVGGICEEGGQMIF